MRNILSFICTGCGQGNHEPCAERNKNKHTKDCDCLHRPPL